MKLIVKIAEIEKFLRWYCNERNIYWSQLSSNENLIWNADLINSYKDIWDWKKISGNSSIAWDPELIQKNIDRIDWRIFINNPAILWDIEKINQFKNQIYFTNKGVDLLNGGKYTGYNYLDDERKDSCFSLSLAKNVCWSEELIFCFEDRWDWTELSSNENIAWNEKLIFKYKERVNFNYLSKNKNVIWSNNLLDEFQDLWNWEYLSGNSSLPWSYEILHRYKNKWKWKPEQNYEEDYRGKLSTHGCEWIPFKHINSISTNTGISWDLKSIMAFKENLDISRVVKYGIILETEIFKIYKNELDEIFKVNTIFTRHSDWHDSYNIYFNGWNNLSLNNSLVLTPTLINFFIFNTTQFRGSSGNAMDGYTEFLEEIPIIKCFQKLDNYDIKDLNTVQLLNNETHWKGFLFNENYIHKSIWNNCIKPYLADDNHVKQLLNNLQFI